MTRLPPNIATEYEDILRWKKIADTVWNYLGINDPGSFDLWLRGAIQELKTTQAKQNDEGEEWKS